jgi:quercetin dioxygenase-like cupin family protein
MEWFWDAYAPTRPARADHRIAEPGQLEQVQGLPPTLLFVDEADVLRDEGEAYAAKLRRAGVAVTTVRYDGTVHDFMLLNSLSQSRAARAAIDQATAFLRAAFGNPSGPAASPETIRPADALAAKLKRTEIQHRDFSIPGREIVQVRTEIPVGVESGWHTHPGEEVGYILAGTVQMEIRDQPTLILHAGEGFLIPPRVPHNALDLGPDTGQMLSTYIVETGQPIATFTH